MIIESAIDLINKEDEYSEEEFPAHSEVYTIHLKEIEDFINKHIGIDYEIEKDEDEAVIQFFEINTRESNGLDYYLKSMNYYI